MNLILIVFVFCLGYAVASVYGSIIHSKLEEEKAKVEADLEKAVQEIDLLKGKIGL